MDHVQIGREGENLAEAFLIERGYKILERNYRLSFGEIDVIAREAQTLCFIEVKTRDADYYGHPFEAVTPAKQRTIRKVAQMYLTEHPDDESAFIRFDVVGIMNDEQGVPVIELLQDAF